MFLIVLASQEQCLSAGTGHTPGVGIDYIITLLPRPRLMAIAWSPVHGGMYCTLHPLRGEPLDADHRRLLAQSSMLLMGFDYLPGPGLVQATEGTPQQEHGQQQEPVQFRCGWL